MAALSLHCCARVFSSCREQWLLSSWSVPASHCSGFSLQALEQWLSSCGTQAYAAPRHVGSTPPGMESLPPALAGGFLTTRPPVEPYCFFCSDIWRQHFWSLCYSHFHQIIVLRMTTLVFLSRFPGEFARICMFVKKNCIKWRILWLSRIQVLLQVSLDHTNRRNSFLYKKYIMDDIVHSLSV